MEVAFGEVGDRLSDLERRCVCAGVRKTGGQRCGHAGRVDPWLQGYARGMTASREGGNMLSDAIGASPVRSVLADSQLCDETLYHNYYREWARRLAPASGE